MWEVSIPGVEDKCKIRPCKDDAIEPFTLDERVGKFT
jgi:hypothetical protein